MRSMTESMKVELLIATILREQRRAAQITVEHPICGGNKFVCRLEIEGTVT